MGRRLREERERLGLSRPDIAKAIGSNIDTIKNWEGGKSSVNATALNFLFEQSGDILYIVTGQSTPPPAEEDVTERQSLTAAQSAVNKISLMNLSESDTQILLLMAKRLAKPA